MVSEPLLAAERGEVLDEPTEAGVVVPRRPLRQRLALVVGAALLLAAAAFVGQGASGQHERLPVQATAPTMGDVQLSWFFLPQEVRLPILDRLVAKIGHPCGRLLPAPRYFSEFEAGIFGIWLSGGVFLLVELVLLYALEVGTSKTSNFTARKLCHAGSGLLFMTLDPSSAAARGAIYLVGFISILMTWEVTKDIGLRPFRFSRPRDVGITLYLIIVMLWFYSQLPTRALAPMFFGDPAGAVVGHFMTNHFPRLNKVWYQHKTRAGSLAVFIATGLALWVFYPPMSTQLLLLLCVGATIAEGIGGDYDNLCLSFVVIGGYYLLVGHD